MIVKYLAKNDETKSIGKKYHTRTNCPMVINLRLVATPDILLKHYGITEQCKTCEAMEEKIKTTDLETDIRKFIPILSSASKVIAKQISRRYLRVLCVEYSLPFTLRHSKLKLSRSVCKYWIRNSILCEIEKHVLDAKEHWQDRIDKKDRHKPNLYIEMLGHCNRVLELLEELA